MKEPLVSVIIPTYNDGARLPIAMRSIIDQTYKNIEILVVDDQSDDDTEKVVREFAASDPRVRYLKTPKKDPRRTDWRGVNINAGCFARNYGMEEALGEWIAFQDGDDASLLNRIEIQLALAEKYKATCLTTSCVKFDEQWLGKTLDAEKYSRENTPSIMEPETIAKYAKQTKGVLMRNAFLRKYVPFTVKKWFPFARKLFFGTQDSYPGAGNSPFFRREVFLKVRYRPLSERVWPALSGRGADRDFLFQVAETFKGSWSVPIPLYLWRVGGNYNPHPGWERFLKK